MRNTPTTLKWLANRRARMAFDLSHLEGVATELTRQVDNMRLDLAGLDRTIQLYDPSIDPRRIENIHSQSRFQRRGELKAAILGALRANAPSWTSTDVLEMVVRANLGISFSISSDRNRWYDNVFRAQLKRFVKQGVVERHQDPTLFTVEVGRWRLIQPQAATLAELQD